MLPSFNVKSGIKTSTNLVKGTINTTTGMVTKGVTTTTGIVTKGVTTTTGIVSTGLTTTLKTVQKVPNFGRTQRQGKLQRQNSWLAWESRVTSPSIKLDFMLECRRLPKKDSFSNADAFCCIWEAPPGYQSTDESGKENRVSRLPSRQEREIGRTEVMRENKDPTFQTSFRLEYRFQEEQTYVVRVYDEDLRYATDLKEHDFIGGCVFTLGDLMGAGGNTIARPLHRGKAYLILTGNEIMESREVLEFRFSGQDLGSLERKNSKVQVAKDVLDTMQKVNVAKTVLDKFDAYFRLEKLNSEDQTWAVVWKSEVIRDNQNPTWSVARIPLQILCDDEPSNPLKISIWLWNRYTPDEHVGFVESTVNELVQKGMRGIPVFDVMIERKKLFGGTKLKKTGVLKVLKSHILQIPSMLQYLSGGCEMDLMIAIDCTAANGDWRDENSLHFHSPTWFNDYQALIHKIASVYDRYEGKRDYTMWGYGAAVRGMPQPYFAIGENLKSADDLVTAYDQLFAPDNMDLELGATAEWKHVVQAGMYRAIRSSKERQRYSTLIILTAGPIADLRPSIDAICAAAEDAPLSIVVIAIGDGDFDGIQQLIGDNETGKLRHSNGVPIARDILTVVPMAYFGGNARECVSEALREVPEQFVQHFTNNGIKPNPPKASPDFSSDRVLKGYGTGSSSGRSNKSADSGRSKRK